ncbi:MAG TPA: hypothetical protein PLX31_17910, partial [Gemmatimonadaceae bacterium]|nr:hypothetical protein [Gemmatimonadaceae bacterium]
MRQELKINPRLYQAMDLLYMPLLDLQQHLKQELLNNPFLEMTEPDEEDSEEEEEREGEEGPVDLTEPETAPPEEREAVNNDTIDWEEILLDGFETGGVREEHEEREYYEPVSVDRRDLDDHLKDQISLLELTPRQLLLADEFLGNINEDGYLTCAIPEIVEGINEVVARAAEKEGFLGELPLYRLDEADDMLRIVQTLDPAGVGARTVSE